MGRQISGQSFLKSPVGQDKQTWLGFGLRTHRDQSTLRKVLVEDVAIQVSLFAGQPFEFDLMSQRAFLAIRQGIKLLLILFVLYWNIVNKDLYFYILKIDLIQ